jgi:ketosteroid isomerase-like protein
LIIGDLAFSSFTADAIFESEGKRTVMPVFYTLGWRKTTDGWRIIHEHSSNLIADDSPVNRTQ